MNKKYKLLKDMPFAPAGTKVGRDEDSVFHEVRSNPRRYRFYEKELDALPEWFEPVIERWKPKEGDTYWVIWTNGDFIDFEWDDYEEDQRKYNFGNCFQTREQAEEAVRRVRKTLLDYHQELAEGQDDDSTHKEDN